MSVFDIGIAVSDGNICLILVAVKAKCGPRADMPDLARYCELIAQTRIQGMQYLFAPALQGINPGQMVFNVRGFFLWDPVTVLDGGNTTLWGVAYNQIYQPEASSTRSR